MSPVQAGIKSLRTPNSSFILDLLRRSIRLCAVLRAIFLPAALVVDGCFFLDPCSGAVFFVTLAGPLALVLADVAMSAGSACACPWGFIWMILRDLVGGGGRANVSLCCWAADDRLRALTASLGWTGYGALGETEEGDVGCADGCVVRDAEPLPGIAEGGSSKAMWRCGRSLLLSCPLISDEEPGVKGIAGRGMVAGGSHASGRFFVLVLQQADEDGT